MKLPKLISILLVLIMITTSISFADNAVGSSEISVRVLIDNESVRVVESFSESEQSIATFDKITNKLVIKSFDISKKTRSEFKLNNVVSPVSNESISNKEIFSFIPSEKVDFNVTDMPTLQNNVSINAYPSLGYGGAQTTYGDYGYFNLWSSARLHAGGNRPIIQVYDKDVATGQPHESNYNTFCDTIDNMRMTEQVAAVAVGGEVLTTIVALIFAPDITATKLAAALGAIGVSATVIGTFITWQFQASTARKYYDKLKPYSS